LGTNIGIAVHEALPPKPRAEMETSLPKVWLPVLVLPRGALILTTPPWPRPPLVPAGASAVATDPMPSALMVSPPISSAVKPPLVPIATVPPRP
jgi:hypothetical protein